MTLSQAALNAVQTADMLDRIRLAHDSLAFCAGVFQRYQSGAELANDHMDVDKARNQLLEAISRTLQSAR
jgi:hypothetical protein